MFSAQSQTRIINCHLLIVSSAILRSPTMATIFIMHKCICYEHCFICIFLQLALSTYTGGILRLGLKQGHSIPTFHGSYNRGLHGHTRSLATIGAWSY